jgi:hypothetical protein
MDIARGALMHTNNGLALAIRPGPDTATEIEIPYARPTGHCQPSLPGLGGKSICFRRVAVKR